MRYADSGINWIFVYEVEYEDEDILILRDLGRFHKFDQDRTYKGAIDGWVDITGDFVHVPVPGQTLMKRKLVEVKPEKRG